MLIEVGRLSLGSIAGVIVGAITGHYFLKILENKAITGNPLLPKLKRAKPKSPKPDYLL